MNLEIRRLPLTGHPLAEAFSQDFQRVERFYQAGSPQRLDSYKRQAERIDEAFPHRALQIREAFSGRDDPSSRRIADLAGEGGYFVATGHQAGLFGGPLMALYKALCAARLAERLSESLGVSVLALFSVASEDHDWLEVNHTHVVDTENNLVRIEVSRESEFQGAEAPDPPIHRIHLGEDVDRALSEMSQAIPDSQHKASVLRRLRDAYRPGDNMAEAFRSTFVDTLADYPIAILPMSDSYTKDVTRDLLWAAWERRNQELERSQERVEELEKEGYQAQVSVAPDTTNLFVEGRLGRDRVVWKDGVAELRRSGERLEEGDLKELIQESASRVSPGALLRPVVEARAFPVIAHVAGPAEIAYLAQSQVLYDLYGVPAPVVVPRASFQLIEPKVRRVLDKYDLGPDSFSGDVNRTIHNLVKARAPESISGSLSTLRKALSEALEAVEGATLEYDPGARSALGSGKAAVFGAVDELESKLESRVREKNRVMQQQLEKVAVNLHPEGTEQERLLNATPFLARYGPQLLRRVYESCELTPE